MSTSSQNKLSKLLAEYKLGPQLYRLVRLDKALLDHVQKLVPDTNYLPEQLYCIVHKQTPICEYGKRRKFKDTWAGYYRCGKTDCMCYLANHSVKISQSKQQLTHDDWEKIIEKRKATNLEKYGTEFAVQSPNIKDKIQKANIQKYGVATTLLVPQVQDKIKKTLLERYGSEHPMQVPEIKQAAMKTCLEKYGHVVYPHSKDGRTVVRDTLKSKHKVASIAQLKFSQDVRELLQDKERFHNLYRELGIHGLCDRYPELNYEMCRAKLLREGINDFVVYSKPEEFVKNILDKNKINYEHNNRKIISPLELDFYCPDHALAIEVCGLYWHQISKLKQEKYHLNKLESCLQKNIQLITIFSDYIYQKPSIVESRLMSKLKLLPRTEHARNLIIVDNLDKKLLADFLNLHHIQGTRLGVVNLAAINTHRQIQAVMTFGPVRKSLGNKNTKQNTYEMYRYAVNGQVPGLASKLFKYFVTQINPDQVISYADRCWSQGQLYEKLGFVRNSVTKPNYWYSKDFITKQHRYTYTKHKLVSLGYDPLLTEFQIMEARGYGRIYDCGSVKYTWTNQHS